MPLSLNRLCVVYIQNLVVSSSSLVLLRVSVLQVEDVEEDEEEEEGVVVLEEEGVDLPGVDKLKNYSTVRLTVIQYSVDIPNVLFILKM